VVEPKNGLSKLVNNFDNVGKKNNVIDSSDQKVDPKSGGPTDKRQKAVALKDSNSLIAKPRVVASGQGTFAEQILQIAWANNIKVREDADLVEILTAIDIDSEIPIEAFAAVAEILTYLYRANGGEAPNEEANERKEPES